MFWSLCFIKHGGSAISLIYVWMVLATARHTKRLGGLGVNESKMLLYMIFYFCNPPKIRIDAFQPWNVTGGNKHRKINGSRSPLTHQPGLGCFLDKACVMCVCVKKVGVCGNGVQQILYIYTCIYIILVNREIYVYIYICTYVDTLAPYMGTVLGIWLGAWNKLHNIFLPLHADMCSHTHICWLGKKTPGGNHAMCPAHLVIGHQ